MTMKNNHILITGANGFVGRHLLDSLHQKGASVRGAVRHNPSLSEVAIGNMSDDTDWTHALQNINTVIHLAARAHVLNDTSADPLKEFRAVNVYATQKLIQDAHLYGVKRFVFLSSIGVLGNQTHGAALDENSKTAPVDKYAVSKQEAEQIVVEHCTRFGMEYVIVRPVLIYGADAPGNFGLLLKLAASGLPLPFDLLKQKRNLLALDNLVDMLALCVNSPHAANQTFVVADDEAVNLSDIISNLRLGMSRPKRLFALPEVLLRSFCSLLRRSAMFDKLNAELLVNNAKAKQVLNWQPPLSTPAALQRVGARYTELRVLK